MTSGLWPYTLANTRYLLVLTESCRQAQSLPWQTRAVSVTGGLPRSPPNCPLPSLCWAPRGDLGVPEVQATSSAGDPTPQPALCRSGTDPRFAVTWGAKAAGISGLGEVGC